MSGKQTGSVSQKNTDYSQMQANDMFTVPLQSNLTNKNGPVLMSHSLAITICPLHH